MPESTSTLFLRDPEAAIRQRRFMQAQALQKPSEPIRSHAGGMAHLVNALTGAWDERQILREARDARTADKAERARREALILGLSTGQPMPGASPGASPAATPMPERLGGAPPATPEESAAGGVITPPTTPPPGGAPDVPPEMRPHFEAASRETGIPVPLLVAQARQESNLNPNARGRAGEIGVTQIMPSTARQPGFGMAGVDPATLSDPGANIMFGARYLAARSPNTDWNNPEARAAALRRYNGGGDPNYAANVSRYLPAGAPAPQPTPPGGVAARTGGADVAGLGAPGRFVAQGEAEDERRFPGIVAQGQVETRQPGDPSLIRDAARATALAATLPGQGTQATPYQPAWLDGAPMPGAAGTGARTGGVAMAAAAPAPSGGQRTPEQLRRAAAQIAALGGTAAQAQGLYAQADAIERRQFVTEDRTETRRLAAEAETRRERERATDNARQDEQLRLARENARNGRLPQGFEYGPDGQPRRINVPTDPNTPYAGNSIEAQDSNILLRGDPASREYAAAFARQSAPRVNVDGSTVTPNMSAYAPPTFNPGGAPAAGAPAPAAPDYSRPTVTEPTRPTADQAKVATFADRITQAMPIIERNMGTSLQDRAASSVPVVGNFMTSTGFQQADQAQRDYINAVLRRESGAAIGADEFENARRQYFPQPGDSPEVLEQKKANRETVMQGFIREAGPAYRPRSAEAPAASGADPAAGALPALPPGFTVVR